MNFLKDFCGSLNSCRQMLVHCLTLRHLMPASLQKPHLLINFQISFSSVYLIKIKHYHLLSHHLTYHAGM